MMKNQQSLGQRKCFAISCYKFFFQSFRINPNRIMTNQNDNLVWNNNLIVIFDEIGILKVKVFVKKISNLYLKGKSIISDININI